MLSRRLANLVVLCFTGLNPTNARTHELLLGGRGVNGYLSGSTFEGTIAGQAVSGISIYAATGMNIFPTSVSVTKTTTGSFATILTDGSIETYCSGDITLAVENADAQNLLFLADVCLVGTCDAAIQSGVRSSSFGIGGFLINSVDAAHHWACSDLIQTTTPKPIAIQVPTDSITSLSCTFDGLTGQQWGYCSDTSAGTTPKADLRLMPSYPVYVRGAHRVIEQFGVPDVGEYAVVVAGSLLCGTTWLPVELSGSIVFYSTITWGEGVSAQINVEGALPCTPPHGDLGMLEIYVESGSRGTNNPTVPLEIEVYGTTTIAITETGLDMFGQQIVGGPSEASPPSNATSLDSFTLSYNPIICPPLNFVHSLVEPGECVWVRGSLVGYSGAGREFISARLHSCPVGDGYSVTVVYTSSARGVVSLLSNMVLTNSSLLSPSTADEGSLSLTVASGYGAFGGLQEWEAGRPLSMSMPTNELGLNNIELREPHEVIVIWDGGDGLPVQWYPATRTVLSASVLSSHTSSFYEFELLPKVNNVRATLPAMGILQRGDFNFQAAAATGAVPVPSTVLPVMGKITISCSLNTGILADGYYGCSLTMGTGDYISGQASYEAIPVSGPSVIDSTAPVAVSGMLDIGRWGGSSLFGLHEFETRGCMTWSDARQSREVVFGLWTESIALYNDGTMFRIRGLSVVALPGLPQYCAGDGPIPPLYSMSSVTIADGYLDETPVSFPISTEDLDRLPLQLSHNMSFVIVEDGMYWFSMELDCDVSNYESTIGILAGFGYFESAKEDASYKVILHSGTGYATCFVTGDAVARDLTLREITTYTY